MIQLIKIAESIETRLNSALENSGINSFFKKSKFEFNICLNSGEYKKATNNEETNDVTYYINAIMKALSSDVEGEANNTITYNATITTSVEFLIPFANKSNNIEKFCDKVHQLISSVLEGGLAEELTEDNETFLVGSKFNVPAPGTIDIMSMVGESLPMKIYGTHYVIAQGVSSNAIELSIEHKIHHAAAVINGCYTETKYERIYPSRLGIARRSITEGNIFSDSKRAVELHKPTSYLETDFSAKNTFSGSALTISFDIPLRMDKSRPVCERCSPNCYETPDGKYRCYGKMFNDRIIEYIATGANEPMNVQVLYPHTFYANKKRDNNDKIIDFYGGKLTQIYKMKIADVGLNGEMGLAASLNVRLIECAEE